MKKMVLYASNAASLVMFLIVLIFATMLYLPFEMPIRMIIMFVALVGSPYLLWGTGLASPERMQSNPLPSIIMLPILIFIAAKGTRLIPLFIGIPALIFCIVFGVQWLFYGAREEWEKFAEQHGLDATGLEVEEFPRMEGLWRGVPVEVQLMFDPAKLGASEENISITSVQANFAQQSTPFSISVDVEGGMNSSGLVVDSVDATLANALLSDPEVVQSVSQFFQAYPNFAEVSEEGVITGDFDMLKTDRIEAMLNHCVDAQLAIRKHL